ncbi:MAG: molybdenum cofactor guanylyltransferase, partial [Gaiellaceae bacterium]|nr:molybdenum cofactor guanylyltransferase [Gaiellaceae bacterium]
MANRVAASGIVLVGGASRRFGSPKALARFRGETLAERAWRLLEEVCVEVLAVGKAADRLSLPFPVVDDRSELRAPIVGLVAGLRAAELPTCLVVPVDCPLLTAEALRALARALAVPQTGPLPGAYPRSLLPELEARIAAGELSLQGVSERVLELDEAILANVNTPGELLAAEVADRAAELDEVQVVLLPRSAARAGERSEACELVLVVDDLEPHLERGAWLDELGVAVRSVTAIGELGVELRL